MDSHLVAAFFVFVLITTTTEGGVNEDDEKYQSVLQCGEKMPDGCRAHEGRACSQRYEELNTVASNHTSWAERVRQLHVLPVTTVTLQSRSVSLDITWMLPHCGSGVSRGVQVKVTALDDVGRYTVCHLLDFTAVSWPAANNSQQCRMTYRFPLPPLKDNYSWRVGVESVPRAAQLTEGWPHSVVSTIVYTDMLTTDPTLKPACGAVTVTYVTGPSSVIVTLHSDVLARDQAYDVILYHCFQCCQWFCQMAKVKGEYLKFPITTARFEGVVPGSYHVWVHKAGSVSDVCARIGVLRFSSAPSSSFTTTTTTITDSTTATTDDSDDEQDQRPVSAGRTGINSSSNSSNRIVVVVVAVSTSFVVVTLVVMVMMVLCWRRHRGQRHRFVKDLPCLEKLTSQTSCESTESYSDTSPVNQRGDNPSATPVCPPPSSPLSVFLLSHSTLPPHTHVTDALALYLQTCCACDVSYARWQMGSILTSGAEEWTRKQLTTSDTVIFVHSPDTQDCYDAWRLGLLKGKQSDTEVRILVTAFEQASKAEQSSSSSSSSWFDISFCSDLLSTGGDGDEVGCVSSPRQNWCKDSRKVDAKQDQNTASETEKATAGWRLAEGKSSSRWFYLLLNDFSQLLADLHHLPNTPRAFKDHGLPTDSQHLETEEGRELYRAVAILNSGPPQGCSGEEAPGNSYRAAAGARNTDSGFHRYPATAGGQKLDSGFEDLSFFAPEDLSVVDSESAVSLAERFRAINAQYEMAMAAERGIVLPECYSLGGRYA